MTVTDDDLYRDEAAPPNPANVDPDTVQVYKVEAADWADAGALSEGDTFQGLEVAASAPGSPHLYIRATERQMADLENRGLVIDSRPEIRFGIPPGEGDPKAPQVQALDMVTQQMGESYSRFIENLEALLGDLHGGQGQVFAVMDTNDDVRRHELFQGKRIEFIPGMEPRSDGGGHGHGHFVLGQMVALMPRARFLFLPILTGADGSGSEHVIVQRLTRLGHWEAEQGYPPTCGNNSWGGGSSQGIDDAYLFPHSLGAWMGCAAGNSGHGASIESPARVSPFVVGAIDWRNNALASFTSGGGRWPQISCYLPGVNEWGPALGGGYRQLSGTSMAIPYGMIVLATIRAKVSGNFAEAAQFIRDHAKPLAQLTQNGAGSGWVPAYLFPGGGESPGEPVDPPEEEHPPEQPTPDGAQVHLGYAVGNLDVVDKHLGNAKAETSAARMRPHLVLAQEWSTNVRIELAETAKRITEHTPPPENGGGGEQPVDPPPDRTVPPGATKTFRTGTGALIRVATPTTDRPGGNPIVMAFAGTGFQGADIGMLPLDMQLVPVQTWEPAAVQNLFTQAGAIYVECAYSKGTVEQQIADALAAFDGVAAACPSWGGSPERIVTVGHSSGGFLAAWMAIARADRLYLATIMSGAALLVNGYRWPSQSQQLLARAGVTDAKSPGKNLDKAAAKIRLALFIAQQDEQIPPQSQVDFVALARGQAHQVLISQMPGMHGASIDPGLRWTAQNLPR